MNSRVPSFRKHSQFVRRFVCEPETHGAGSVWDRTPSQDTGQRCLLVADGSNDDVRNVPRATGGVIASFGRPGRQAGDFHGVHNVAIGSQGRVRTSEMDTGKRAQRWVRVP